MRPTTVAAASTSPRSPARGEASGSLGAPRAIALRLLQGANGVEEVGKGAPPRSSTTRS